MKVLFIGIDALDPRLVYKHIDKLPTLKGLMDKGVGGSYGAYAYGYSSIDNWISIYTGLTPKEHGVIENRPKGIAPQNDEKAEYIIASIFDYMDKQPFWQVIEANTNLKMGIWDTLTTAPGIDINGYMLVSDRNEYFLDDCPKDSYLTPQFVGKDKHLQDLLIGEINYPIRPRSFEQLGDVNDKIGILNKHFCKAGYYKDGMNWITDTLAFWENNLAQFQHKYPVDIMWIYTGSTDMLFHFEGYDYDSAIILDALEQLDACVGRLIDKLMPENVIFMSDHGMSNFADCLSHTDIDVQKEAFGWRDISYWVNSDLILSDAKNGAIISAVHECQGLFIAAGDKIKHTAMPNMRTVDFYPTFLELCGVSVPPGRSGMVLDIFNHDIINTQYAYKATPGRNVLLIQNLDVNLFNSVINEFWLANRFDTLSIICEPKYISIFNANSRLAYVFGTDMHVDRSNYDCIVTGCYNLYRKQASPLVVWDKV